MFSRLVTLLPIAALVAVAIAVPDLVQAPDAPKCNIGGEYCCSQKFSEPTRFTDILSDGTLINALVDAKAIADLTCNPITAAGVGSGGKCSVQTACCTMTGQVDVCDPIAVDA